MILCRTMEKVKSCLQKITKKKFWIPKYTADAYDGKALWLLITEEELLDKYHYGAEAPGEQYVKTWNHSKVHLLDRRLLIVVQILIEIFD